MKLVILAFLLSVAAHAQSVSCAQAMASPSIQLSGAPTCTASSCSYTDSTVSDGTQYAYVAVATDMSGSSCSNILTGVLIPSTGTHTVSLTFVPSTTSGVTYALFRAANPANPTGLAATVN